MPCNGGTTQSENEISQLNDRYPIALLPVRVESRFDDNNLKVRIYPDSIHLDSHELPLTPSERSAGEAYWSAIWGKWDEATAQEAWRILLRRFSAQRAAWLVASTTPRNFDILQRPTAAPDFPKVTAENSRATAWTRPVLARALPHRWVVILYGMDGAELCRVESKPVMWADVAVTFDPLAAPPSPTDALVNIQDDPDVGWMVNFQKAVDSGMAVTITGLSEAEVTAGFSRLLVLGVRTNLDPQQSGALLAALFNAHHYSGGFAFVEQGTPTNNIAGLPAGFPPADLDGRNSLKIERGAEWQSSQQLLTEQHDGYRFASALRLPLSVVEHIERSHATEQLHAQAMTNVIFPATLGYFIEQMLAAEGQQWAEDRPIPWELMAAVRNYVVRWVKGRGPYPAFRVGNMPYGLLPVTSMKLWQWPSGTPNGFRLEIIHFSTLSNVEVLVERRSGLTLAGGQSWTPAQPITAVAIPIETMVAVTPFELGVSWLTFEMRPIDGVNEARLAIISIDGSQSFFEFPLSDELVTAQVDSTGMAMRSNDEGVAILVACTTIEGDELKRVFYYQLVAGTEIESLPGSNTTRLADTPFHQDLPPIAVEVAQMEGNRLLEVLIAGVYQQVGGNPVAYLRIHRTTNNTDTYIDLVDAHQIDAITISIADSGDVLVFVTCMPTPSSTQPLGYCFTLTRSGEIISRATFPGVVAARALTVWAIQYNPLAALPTALATIRSIWLDASVKAPHVTPPISGSTNDPDVQLLNILAQDASARAAYYRAVAGGDTLRAFYHASRHDLLPAGWQAWSDAQLQLMNKLLASLGDPFAAYQNRPSNQRLRLFDLAFNVEAHRFPHPLTRAANDLSLLDRVVHWPPLPIDGVEGSLKGFGADQTSLFFRMVRHSLALEYFNAAYDLIVQLALPFPPSIRRERELIGMRNNGTLEPTFWSIFELSTGSPEAGDLSIGSTLYNERHMRPGPLKSHLESLELLKGVTESELDRLFSETLDLFSHRIDAWITSLAAMRLEKMAAPGDTNIYVGAYGWVENLKKADTPDTEIYETRSYNLPKKNAGSIHAPSLDHATTAAILRNGFLARTGVDHSRLALDLSSARVRSGRDLLDTVWHGQPLGANLGRRFEARLRAANLDRYVDPIRRRFPQVAPFDGKFTPEAAARAVVDGQALRLGWSDAAKMKWGEDGLPAVNASNADYAKLVTILREVLGSDPTIAADAQSDPLDAPADLLTAESLFQLVRGNNPASAAAMDALSRGMRATEPEVSRTTLSGIPLTFRVVLLLDDSAAPGWSTTITRRAALDPQLDAWVGRVLGDPAAIFCTVAYPAESALADASIALKSLDLRPLDFLAAAAHGAELQQRVAYHALELAKDPAISADQLTIDYAKSKGKYSFGEALEVARALNTLIGVGEALYPHHLQLLNTATSGVTIKIPAEERAQVAFKALTDLLPPLDAKQANSVAAVVAADLADAIAAKRLPDATKLKALREALRPIANFGLAAAVPESATGATVEIAQALLNQAENVRSQAQHRLDEAAAAADDYPKKVRVLFQSKMLMLPTFEMEVGALTTEPGFDSGLERESQIQCWINELARVRPNLDKWRRLWLYLGAYSGSRPSWHISQLSHDGRERERWVALHYSGSPAPTGANLSIAFHPATLPSPSSTGKAKWTGLLIDEWPEVIPKPEAMTGISFNYDAPGAEPPQSLLIAVPPSFPDGSTTWSLQTLENIVNETLDMAHVRAVDGDQLDDFGHLLPTMLLAANVLNETISTNNLQS